MKTWPLYCANGWVWSAFFGDSGVPFLPSLHCVMLTQCYKYTPEGVCTTEGQYYVCVLSKLSVINGERPNKFYLINPDYTSNKFVPLALLLMESYD